MINLSRRHTHTHIHYPSRASRVILQRPLPDRISKRLVLYGHGAFGMGLFEFVVYENRPVQSTGKNCYNIYIHIIHFMGVRIPNGVFSIYETRFDRIASVNRIQYYHR